MKKYIRKHLKDEKRILKLMYKKGITEQLSDNFREYGWESLCRGKKGRRRNGAKYIFTDYLPEFHLFTVDYWGECDSHSIVSVCRDNIMMKDAEYCQIDGWSNMNMTVRSAKGLIDYLSKLPTVRNDSQFNKCLKISL